MADVGLETNAPAKITANALWYKDAVIYQLHVKSFCDGNGDGIGDFDGLISKLDYISSLGANTVWLLPFYPSPRKDDGYDVSAYRDIHPDYGPLSDFRNFVRQAQLAVFALSQTLLSITPPISIHGSSGPCDQKLVRGGIISTYGVTLIKNMALPQSFSETSRNPTGNGTRRPARTIGTGSSHISQT